MRIQTGKSMPIILAVVLGGCSMIPNDGQPDATAVQRDSVKLKLTTRLELDEWRYYFPDPRLQRLIGVALENNRDLPKAAGRIAEVYAQYGILQTDGPAGQDPAAPRNDTSRQPDPGAPAASEPAAQQYHPGDGLLSYEADFWGHIRSPDLSARSGYLDTGPAQRAFRLSLIATVADTYVSLLEIRERARLAEANVKACAETQNLIGLRHQAGVSSDSDLLQAQKAYQAAAADQAELDRLQANEVNLLSALIGEPLAAIWDSPEALGLDEQGAATGLFAGLPAEALTRRPDIQAAEQQLQALGADIEAARAACFPRITLTGETGKASKGLTGLFDPGNGSWDFQPAAGIPLFDGRHNPAGREVVKSRDAAVADYQNAIQQAFREVADLLAARGNLAGRLALQQANTETQVDALRLVQVRYKIGVVSHLEVLAAQRQVIAAEQSELEARGAWLITAAQLYKALGGEGNDAKTTPQTAAAAMLPESDSAPVNQAGK